MRHDSSHRKRERSSKTTTITQSKKSTPFGFAPIRPKKARGTSQRFVISKEDFIGEYDVDPIQYDLMTVVLIWVRDSTDPNYNNKLMKMLSLFF